MNSDGSAMLSSPNDGGEGAQSCGESAQTGDTLNSSSSAANLPLQTSIPSQLARAAAAPLTRPQLYGVGHKVLLAGKTKSSRYDAVASHSHSPTGQPSNAKRKRKRTETFALYIYKVLKSVHTETGIGRNSMCIMNSFINDIFDRLCTEAVRLLVMTKRKTLTKHEMRTAAKLVIPGELLRHAHDEAMQAVNKFEQQRDNVRNAYHGNIRRNV